MVGALRTDASRQTGSDQRVKSQDTPVRLRGTALVRCGATRPARRQLRRPQRRGKTKRRRMPKWRSMCGRWRRTTVTSRLEPSPRRRVLSYSCGTCEESLTRLPSASLTRVASGTWALVSYSSATCLSLTRLLVSVSYSSATCALEHRALVAPAQYLVFLKG